MMEVTLMINTSFVFTFAELAGNLGEFGSWDGF